jgi:hypothetical protein
MSALDNINSRIRSLENRSKAEDGAITFSFDYSTDEMETGEDKSFLYAGIPQSNLEQDEGIALPSNLSYNYSVVPDAPITASVSVEERLGMGGVTYATPLENCLNGNIDDFWMDTILVEYPILAGNVSSANSWLPTSYQEGAAIKLKFSFPVQVMVSEIALYPISPFPLEVLEVTYTTSNDTTIQSASFTIFSTENKTILSLTSSNNDKFIYANNIWIVINQPTYIFSSYLVPKKDLVSQQYYAQISQTQILDTASYIIAPGEDFWNEETSNPYIINEKTKYLQEWSDVLGSLYSSVPKGDDELLGKAKELGGLLLQLVSVLYQIANLPSDTEYIPKTFYEYVYGLREVEFRYREYGTVSRFVSKTLSTLSPTGKHIGEVRKASVYFESDDQSSVTDDLSYPKDITFWLSLRDDLTSRIFLPGDGTEADITIGEDIIPVVVTDEFTHTSDDAKIMLNWLPYIEFDAINQFTRNYYPTYVYNPNKNTYADSVGNTLDVITPPVTMVIQTPTNLVIPADAVGEDYLTRNEPVLASKIDNISDNTILEELTISEISQLFTVPSLQATLSDLGYASSSIDISMGRRFFRSRYWPWMRGTAYNLCIYYDSKDYVIPLPPSDVLYDYGIVIFRAPMGRWWTLDGVPVDLQGGALQVKAYEFYYLPHTSATPTSLYSPVPFCQNKTDYVRGYIPDVTKTPFNNDYTSSSYYPVITYAHTGNILQLNKAFKEEDGYTIKVSYQTLKQAPRLIVDYQTLTPAIAATPVTIISGPQSTPRLKSTCLHLKAIVT